MGNVFFFDWEVSLMLWLQAHLGAFGIKLASLCSAFGEEMILILVMGFCYWCWNKELGVFIGTNFCMTNVWNPMAKNIALRRRPYFDTPVKCLKVVDPSADMYDIAAQGFSFPSGHSAGAVATYGSIGAFVKKGWAWAIAVVIPLLVGVSRFCVGAHYPTDVLCGWLLGVLAIFIVSVVGRKFRHKWAFYLLLTATALPGLQPLRGALREIPKHPRVVEDHPAPCGRRGGLFRAQHRAEAALLLRLSRLRHARGLPRAHAALRDHPLRRHRDLPDDL